MYLKYCSEFLYNAWRPVLVGVNGYQLDASFPKTSLKDFIVACACSCGNSDAGVGPSPSPSPSPGPGPGPGKSFILEYSNGVSSESLAVIQPRGFVPYSEIVHLPNDSVKGLQEIKLTATKRHRINSVSCFKVKSSSAAKGNNLALKKILKKRGNSISDSYEAISLDNPLHLVAGDQAEFIFDAKTLAPLKSGQKRVFTVKANGFYTPLSVSGKIKAVDWYTLLTKEEKQLLYTLYINSGKPIFPEQNQQLKKVTRSSVAFLASFGIVFGINHIDYSKVERSAAFSFGAHNASADTVTNTSTPLLKSKSKSGDFVIENDFLFSKESSLMSSKDLGMKALKDNNLSGDEYVLRNLEIDEDGNACLLIKEIEPEESFISEITLFEHILNEDEELLVSNDFSNKFIFSKSEIENNLKIETKLISKSLSNSIEHKSNAVDSTSHIDCQAGDVVLINYHGLADDSEVFLKIESYQRDWIMGDGVPFTLSDRLSMLYQRSTS